VNQALSCRICGNTSGNRPFVAREMMFGMRDTFDYFECAACGCLQITRIPENLGKYYPDQYYSFERPHPLKVFIKGPWLTEPFTMATACVRALGFLPGVRVMPNWMKHLGDRANHAILDVGSGNGLRLIGMRNAGFRDLTGVDPFIQKDLRYSNGVQVLKRQIRDMERKYDLVMLHHSYEHMPDPLGTLQDVGKVLKEDGTVLIRIPVVSFLWKTYGPDWLGLDPPRHLYIHTVKSLSLAADRAGLEIVDSYYDSDFLTFIASEQYKRDIPLLDARSFVKNKRNALFTKAQLREFREKTARMNREKNGDSGAFYLRRKKAK
jgi:SAM-dependent methyltransferase